MAISARLAAELEQTRAQAREQCALCRTEGRPSRFMWSGGSFRHAGDVPCPADNLWNEVDIAESANRDDDW